MKKVLIFVLAVLTVGQMAFASGGSQSGGGAAGAKPVSIYTWWGDSERTMGEALVADFQAAHPDIKVEKNFIVAEYLSKLNTMMASGSPPDVFYLNEYLLNEWGEKGAVEDLYPYFQKAGIDADKFYVSSALYKTGNHLWGINPSVVTICLFYNKELFRQAGVTPPPDSATNPWTWDQFVAAAKKLTKDSQGRTPNDSGFNYDQVVQYGTVTPTGNWIYWLPLLYSAGTSLADANGTSLAMASPAGTDMIQKIANLSLVDKVAPTFAMSQSSAFSSLPTLLMNGQVAMFIGGTFQQPDFGNEKFDVGVAQIPSVTGKGNNMAWASGFQLRKGAPQEAFDLLLYLTDFNNWVKAAKNHNIALNGLPQTNSTYNDPALNATWRSIFDPTMAKTAGDILQNASRVGENVTLKNFAELMDQIIKPELDKVWLGEETAQQAMQVLVRQTQGKFQGVWK
jgi:multiple sugar transport system substrate-binding protein